MPRSASFSLLILLASCSVPEFTYPPAPPRIVRFSATPFEPAPGAEVLITYEVEDASARVLLGGPDGPLPLPEAKGTLTLRADQERTLTLEATGPGGTTVARAAFRPSASAPVRIVAFEATPARAYPGALAQVSWRTQNARRVTIDGDDGTSWYTGAMADGTLAVPVRERDLTLHLRADGDQGPVTASVTIRIDPRLPLILSFEAAPVTFDEGGDLTLTWSTSSARRVLLLEETPAGPVPPLAISNSGNLVLRPGPGLHRFRLRAENEVGTSEESLAVWVLSRAAPQILNFTATPTVVGSGGDVELSWRVVPNVGDPNVSTQLDLGRLFAPQAVEPAGTRRIPVERSSEVSLTVLRFGSVVDSERIDLQVDPRLPTLSASINTNAARPGEPLSFVAEFAGADRARIVDGSGQVIVTSTTSPLIAETPAVRSFTYRVIAENTRGNTTRHFPVYVGALPPPPLFTVDDATVRRYRWTCFRWDAPGADWVDLATGFSATGPLPPTGTHCARISDFSGVATLTAVNLTGTSFQQVNIQVLSESFSASDEEPNDTPATALGPYSEGPLGITGSLEAGGQDLYVWDASLDVRPIGATAPGTCNQPIEVEVREDRRDPAQGRRVVIESAGGCPTIDARLTPALADLTPPYLFVLRHPTGSNAAADYFLVLNSEPRVCGDGVVDLREDCDDGGLTSGDGCSSTCFVENDETEPNTQSPDALSIGAALDGYLSPGDQDNFEFQIDLASAGPYRLAVVPTTSEGLAVELTVFDPIRGFTVFGAPLGPTGGASIEPTALYLEAGPYLVSLRTVEQGALPTRGPYRLILTAE